MYHSLIAIFWFKYVLAFIYSLKNNNSNYILLFGLATASNFDAKLMTQIHSIHLKSLLVLFFSFKIFYLSTTIKHTQLISNSQDREKKPKEIQFNICIHFISLLSFLVFFLKKKSIFLFFLSSSVWCCLQMWIKSNTDFIKIVFYRASWIHSQNARRNKCDRCSFKAMQKEEKR